MRKALLLLLLSTLLVKMEPSIIANSPAPSLAERLGFKSSDKILIINVDDVGNSHAANAAVIDAMENGLATSSTVIVPGPWFPEIAAYAKSHPNSDFGVHLAHTSEWKTLKWGPVASKSEVPGLVDPQGYLWPDIMNVYKNSTPEQAYVEARAQIKKALDAGIDVTHIDSHMGTLQYNEAYFQVYRRLAREFNLPLRMGSQELLAAQGGGHQRGQLDADGVIYTDYLIHGDRKPKEPIRDYWMRSISSLKPGVTELYIHASVPGDEIKHITNSWEDRAAEYELFTRDPEVRRILDSQGVKRIGYRALRDLQRKVRSEMGSPRSSSLLSQSKETSLADREAEAFKRWFVANARRDYLGARTAASIYLTTYPMGRYASYTLRWLESIKGFTQTQRDVRYPLPHEWSPGSNQNSRAQGSNPVDLLEEATGGLFALASLAEELIEAGADVNTRF